MVEGRADLGGSQGRGERERAKAGGVRRRKRKGKHAAITVSPSDCFVVHESVSGEGGDGFEGGKELGGNLGRYTSRSLIPPPSLPSLPLPPPSSLPSLLPPSLADRTAYMFGGMGGEGVLHDFWQLQLEGRWGERVR